MPANRNAVTAGIFIVTAALMALGVVVVVSGPDRFTAKQSYVAVFDINENLQGIRSGDQVRLGGIRVGNVTSVDLDSESTPPLLKVGISLPKKYVLKQGATVSVEALIGSASLNIDSLGTGTILPEGGRLDGNPSFLTKIGNIVPKIEEILADVRHNTLPKAEAALDEYRSLAADARKNLMPRLASAAEEGEATIKRFTNELNKILDAYYAVMADARVAVRNVGDFIGPSTGPATLDFKQTIANLKDSTTTLKDELPQITQRAKKVLDLIDERVTALKSTTDDLKETMANIRVVTGDARTLLTDNRARIERMIASLEGTAANAKLFSAEVLRRPSRLIWRDDPKTTNNLSVYFTAREFAEGAQELNDATQSLKDALKDPRITSEELQRRLDTMNAAFDRFSAVEDKLYKSVKE